MRWVGWVSACAARALHLSPTKPGSPGPRSSWEEKPASAQGHGGPPKGPPPTSKKAGHPPTTPALEKKSAAHQVTQTISDMVRVWALSTSSGRGRARHHRRRHTQNRPIVPPFREIQKFCVGRPARTGNPARWGEGWVGKVPNRFFPLQKRLRPRGGPCPLHPGPKGRALPQGWDWCFLKNSRRPQPTPRGPHRLDTGGFPTRCPVARPRECPCLCALGGPGLGGAHKATERTDLMQRRPQKGEVFHFAVLDAVVAHHWHAHPLCPRRLSCPHAARCLHTSWRATHGVGFCGGGLLGKTSTCRHVSH